MLRANGSFQRESAGDRLLTVMNDKVAYIAQSRWVAPAAVLFDEAVLAAFDSAPGAVRLISRGEPARAAYALRLDVRNFEAHYNNGPEAAPTVIVRVRASLTRANNNEAVAEQMIEASVTAGDNRVGAITRAYDEALGEVLQKLVVWTNAKAS